MNKAVKYKPAGKLHHKNELTQLLHNYYMTFRLVKNNERSEVFYIGLGDFFLFDL